jgi:hypothetical protein
MKGEDEETRQQQLLTWAVRDGVRQALEGRQIVSEEIITRAVERGVTASRDKFWHHTNRQITAAVIVGGVVWSLFYFPGRALGLWS